MSFESTRAVNMIAGEDLRGDVFKLLTISNASGVGRVVKTTAPANVAVGFLAEEPRKDAATTGETVPVVIIASGGVGNAIAGANVTAGQVVVAHATAGTVTGVASVAAMADDSTAVGIALESAVAGDVFRVLMQPMTSSASA